MQRKGVDHGGQHAHVISGGAIHAAGTGSQATEDIATTDNERRLYAEGLDLTDVPGDAGCHSGIDPERLCAHEGFARELEENSAVHRGRSGNDRVCHRLAIISTSACGPALLQPESAQSG